MATYFIFGAVGQCPACADHRFSGPAMLAPEASFSIISRLILPMLLACGSYTVGALNTIALDERLACRCVCYGHSSKCFFSLW